MLKRAEPPICVGLYARWGSGKTFMISLLKKEFDPSVKEDPHTRQLLQFFEKGYKKPEPEQEETVDSLIRGLLLTILLAFMPTMSYGVTTFLSIICDAFDPRDALRAAWAWGSSLKRSCARWKSSAKTGPSDATYQSIPQSETKKEFVSSEKEFIFVDFNAWEYAASTISVCFYTTPLANISCTLHTLRFADSDALWAGLVRGVYKQVEKRVEAGKYDKVWNKEQTRFKWQPIDNRDFKREWRVERAKKQLIERFGLPLIRMAIAYAVVVLLVLVALIVVEVTGTTHIITALHASVASSIETALAVITGLVATVAAILPSFKLAFASNKESNVSRGDELFEEASTIRDQLGFLAKVKDELQLLFDFLHEFDNRIVIVPIIDDLDRCITDGRNVKVLEAMQLLLSVPGAPIISFLAVDSRIVVASIEEHYEKVFAKTNISGFEYLDKIVQIPFALPEPPPDKVKRLMSKTLEGEAASPEQVAQRLGAFSTRGLKFLKKKGGEQVTTFKLAPTREDPEGAEVSLAKLVLAIEMSQGKDSDKTLEVDPKQALKDVLAIEEFQGKDAVNTLKQALARSSKDKTLKVDSKQALKLVCAAARQLGPYLKALADQLLLMDKSVVNIYCMNKEEAVEILCRETNAALEYGTNSGFGEVRVYTAHPHLLTYAQYL